MPKTADRGITVFEAANDDLKEIYVAWTRLPIHQAIGELGDEPPAVIAHWKPRRQRISYRSLEFDQSTDSARAFIARHLRKRLPEGWKFVLDPDARDPSAPR
jgi:hypothetical protein